MKKEEISCEYIMHMGDDLNVVNNARVSFDKESDWKLSFSENAKFGDNVLSDNDQGLIRFLATGFRKSEWNEMIQSVRTMGDEEIHKLFLKLRRHAAHWAPMAHPHVQMRITAPIFLARQYVKHQIGLTWSEVSRRYTDGEPSFWFPEGWRARPEGGVKQGSSDECVDEIKFSHCEDEEERGGWVVWPTADAAEEVLGRNLNLYLDMIEAQVAPELARIVLPQNMMVTWRWTGSLAAFARVCQQRLDPHAQKEAQILGREIGTIMADLFPVTWDAMVGDCMGHLNT